MTYSEKLRDPRWQKKRLEIFARDGWKCLLCESTDRNLQVHHVVYRRIEPWAYPDYLYQTLCEKCHEERKELTDKIVDAVRISVMHVPTVRMAAAAHKICSEAMLEIGDVNGASIHIAGTGSGPLSVQKQKQGSLTVRDTSKTSLKSKQ